MIALQEITTANFDAVIALSVHGEQADFVAPNAYSIAQSKVMPECVPLAICADDTPVGFLMYCIDRDDGQWWLYRLMVDKAHQGKGYGRAAMEALLAIMGADLTHRIVYLGVEPENAGAIGLYQSLGFDFDGRVFGKERTMALRL